MKIGILGGSFDPPTLAHTSIAKIVMESKFVDEVWLTPSYNPCQKDTLMKFWSRAIMCRYAIEDIINLSAFYHNKISVSTLEAKHPEQSSTYHLFKALREQNINDKFYMIIGMDQAINIETWYKWKELINSVPFIIFDRNTKPGMDNWFNQYPHIYMETSEIPNVSSTMYRKMKIKDTYDKVKKIVSPQVYNYAENFYKS